MDELSWLDIEALLKYDIQTIFESYNIITLTDYEKRKIIFEYLCDTMKYDFDFYNKIKASKILDIKLIRNLRNELYKTIITKHGVCSGLSQYYHLLLEQVGILSFCVICDNNEIVYHEVCYVYNKDTDSYSIDDITNGIFNRMNKEDYFDYDIDTANKYGQGNKLIGKNKYWYLLPNELTAFYAGYDYNGVSLKNIEYNQVKSVKENNMKKV